MKRTGEPIGKCRGAGSLITKVDPMVESSFAESAKLSQGVHPQCCARGKKCDQLVDVDLDCGEFLMGMGKPMGEMFQGNKLL